MTMIRPGGKAKKIADDVMKTKAIEIDKPKKAKKKIPIAPVQSR